MPLPLKTVALCAVRLLLCSLPLACGASDPGYDGLDSAVLGLDGSVPSVDGGGVGDVGSAPDGARADAAVDAASSVDTGVADAAVGTAQLVPAQGVLLGQYYGDGDITTSAARVGRSLPIHLTYYAFEDDWTQGSTKADLTAGRTPLVNWRCSTPSSTTSSAAASTAC